MDKIEKVFPFGFWNYHGLGGDVQKPEEAARWAECGMSLTLSPRFNLNHDKQAVIDMLDACQEQGIRLILDIPELQYLNAANEEKYRNDVKFAYDNFGHHPATFGFFVADEPATTAATYRCIQAYKIQKEIAPELYPYVNHLAEWDGMDIGDRTFLQWLDEYERDSQAWMISFDHYGQMIKNQAGIESYFKNLKYFSDTSIKYNCKMWVTLLASGHFNFLTPNEQDVLWQIGTSVACGAQGIFWYMFYGGIRQGDCNYRGAPIDEFNEKSPTYYAIKKAQNRFHIMYGKTFSELRCKKVFMIEKAWGGFKLFEKGDHDVILEIKSPENMPAIVSFWEDAVGKHYACFCNNSFDKQGHLEVVFNKKTFTRFDRVCYNGRNMYPFISQSIEQRRQAKDGDTMTLTEFWFGPGQLELIALD